MSKNRYADLTPAVGDAAPSFSLEAVLADGSRGRVALVDLLREVEETDGRGLVVYFYPKAGTPGCTQEACDFRDSLEPLREAGFAVVGISPDGMDAIEKFHKAEALTFPLASDPDHAVAEAFNAYGKHNVLGRLKTSVIRSTFVVAADGTLTHVMRNVRAAGHVSRLIAELDAA
ncbi:MAG TPA: peroxiredoxin [Actinomycetaceae bacterium]|nr:peroxiredoxin [Actinomycetaceae bacterium]